jgi:peptidase A4-like protein
MNVSNSVFYRNLCAFPSLGQSSCVRQGIDGYSSNTVEQTGTDSDCSSGTPTYYAWYEFYPHFAYYVPNMRTINAGDVMSAEVRYSGGMFTVTITDVTTGATYSKSQKMANAQRSSAEWIIEAPYSGGVLPLSDFGTVSFGQDSTKVADTCYATLGGNTLPIGSWGTTDEITMVTSSGATKAQPSALSTDKSSFTETWVSAGP